jgi:DNA-binding NarL/FixJ family response regulator
MDAVAESEVFPAKSEPPPLTRRQEQIVYLLSLGYTAKEIGDALGVATRTVRAHVDALRLKLHVDRQREICRAYRELYDRDPYSLASRGTNTG